MKKIVHFALCLILLASPVFWGAKAQTINATLALDPINGSYKVGQIFTLNIKLNTNGNSTDGVDVRYLNYNPALLEVQDADSTKAGVQIQAGNLYPNTNTNSVNTSLGRVSFSQTSSGGSTYNGTGVLASITFKVLSVGAANLTFNFTSGSTIDTNVASSGKDVLSSVTNTSYSLTEATDTVPPQISNVVASSIGKTTATIGWTTDEPATSLVEYGHTISYGLSTALLTNLQATHSVNLSELEPGTIYHYRVKSKDAQNNQTISQDNTFTTTDLEIPGQGEDTPPQEAPLSITDISITNITQTSATIHWKTNKPTMSKIEYSLTPIYIASRSVPFMYNYTTDHARTISYLSPGITYYYRLVNKEQTTGNIIMSEISSFTTATAVGSGTPQSSFVGTVKGKITIDSLTGLPLANAQIKLLPGNYSANSLIDGSYQLNNVTIGTYSLSVSKTGYVSYTVPTVNVSADKTSEINAYLLTESSGGGETSNPPAPPMPVPGVSDVSTAYLSFMAYPSFWRGGYYVGAGKILENGKTQIVSGAGFNFEPQVNIFDDKGYSMAKFLAYDKGFKGGVRVAVCDLEGDGRNKVVAAPGPGNTPHVQIFSNTGKSLTSFWALDGRFRGGVFVACGDVNGDAKDEIIISAGKGGGPQVMVYNKNGQAISNFFAYNSSFWGGVSVATADVNGDGTKEIITVPEEGSVQVLIFDIAGHKINNGFYAFNQNFKGGASVAGGDVNSDGKDEIIIGVGKNGGSQIRILNENGDSIANDLFAYDKNYAGGVNVAAGDMDNDGKMEILSLPRYQGGPNLRVFKLY